MSKDYAIHWFRRDLRVAGNTAFQQAYKRHGNKILGVFFFDSTFLGRSDFSHNRFQFFMETMRSLKNELNQIGSDLLVLDMTPDKGFPFLLKSLQKKPNGITFNRDYEPFARNRDQTITELLEKEGIKVSHFKDHLIIEPNELSKDDGTAYKVYSPFARKWLEIFSDSDEIQERISLQKKSFIYLQELEKGKTKQFLSAKWSDFLNKKLEDQLDVFLKKNLEQVDITIPKAGSLAALQTLKKFKVEHYDELRDFPVAKATSSLSHFLKNGSISIWQIIAYLDLKPYIKKKSGMDVYFSELIWREFYYHVLYHFPENEKQSFLNQYDKIKWENDLKLFEAWKQGKTGFPIVDAGMRELNTTGFMHNRVRMIVASFLTKDLLIDWRWGEQYFMEKLLDGDLAANNGGWQWAASTGCDPQPYFRIFNPWLQSKKFDKDGDYIKKFVPELLDVVSKDLHSPILNHKSYPEPIVDHSKRREMALEMYKLARDS